MLAKMKNMILPENKESKDGSLNDESTDEDENASKQSDEETTDEETATESEESSEDDDEVEIFLTKIKTLRSKCKKMKQKYSVLKEKYDEVKSNGPSGNKDNSEFTKIVASLMAAEGAIQQHKIYLKEYARKNKIPMDGLNEEGDADSFEDEQEQKGENDAVDKNKEASEEDLSSISGESNSGTSSLDGESDNDSTESGSVPLAPVEVRSDTNSTEMMSNNNNNNTAAVTEMGSGLPVTSNSELPGVESESVPSAVSSPATSTATVSDDSAVTGSLQQPLTGSESQPAAISKISGGRSHFIRKNNIKTHRHHKRRNRHQTLKNML
jgi:hypothetical protein